MANAAGLVDTKVMRKRMMGNDFMPLSESSKKRLRCNKRSLLDLNDDCLLGVFKHLSQIDICHVQNTCTRFVPLTERAFATIVRRKRDWSKSDMEGSESNIRLIFYKFGHLFHSFHIFGNIGADIVERLTHVQSLILAHLNLDWKMAHIVCKAKHLKVLDLVECKFASDGRGNTSPITSKCIQKKRSSLIRLIFQQKVPPIRIFRKFLQCNQELRCLGIPIDIPQNYICHILKHAQQLSELVLFTNETENRTQIYQLVSNLRNPKLLAVNGSANLITVAPLLEGIKQTTADISLLILSDFIIDQENVKIISEMKNLEHIVLKGKVTCAGTELVSLVASLPLLNNFTISFKSCSTDYPTQNVSFSTLKYIVKAGRELDFLKFFFVREIQINEDDYAELVDVFLKNSRKAKLSVGIEGCKLSTSFDVPMYVQRSDLKIDYERSSRCKCTN